MKVIVLGASGMLGHIVSKYFSEKGHNIIATSMNPGSPNFYDAYQNVYGIEKIIKAEQPDAIINCIGILNQAAESNHALASLLNSFLPNYLDQLSAQYSFKLAHVTTDCVFSGKRGAYSRHDTPDADTFYGLSKALGEVNNDRALTLRTSIVGPDQNPNGIGLFKWFTEQSGTIRGYSKVIWTGITTLQLAKIIEYGLTHNITGLHHAVNGDSISKHDLVNLFANFFNSDIEITPDDSKVSDKSLIRVEGDYDFNIPSYEQMVKEMYDWVLAHSEMYPDLIKKVVKK